MVAFLHTEKASNEAFRKGICEREKGGKSLKAILPRSELRGRNFTRRSAGKKGQAKCERANEGGEDAVDGASERRGEALGAHACVSGHEGEKRR